MDFEKIKRGFVKYLQNLNNDTSTTTKYNTTSGAKLFTYTDELEDYLKINGYKDASNLNSSIEDFKDADVIDGKIVLKNQKNGFWADMLNYIFADDSVKALADKNGDGVLQKDEIQNFFTQIASTDGKEGDISIKDISSSVKNFFTAATNNANENAAINAAYNANNAAAPTKANAATVSLDNMSLEQLQNEKTSRETAVNNATEALNAAYNGDNEQIKAAKETLDAAEDNYNKMLDEDEAIPQELKNSQKQNTLDIKENEKAIDAKNIEISNQETAIFKQEDAIAQLDSAISSLEASKTSLQAKLNSLPNDELNASKRSIVKAKIASVEEQIQSKKNEKAAAGEERENLKKDRDTYKADLSALEQTKITLKNTQKDIENKIEQTASDAVKTALKEFQKARSDFDTAKLQVIQSLSENLETAKTELAEVNNKITEVQNKKIAKENSVYLDEIFTDESLKVDYQEFVDENGKKLPYMVISPENIDENSELPLILYMHGAGGNFNPLKQGLPKGIQSCEQMGLKNFNGYILCPLKGGSMWANDETVSTVSHLVQNFTENHKVDETKITGVGFSLGGLGILYFAQKNPELFSKLLIVSSASGNGSVDFQSFERESFQMPIRGYAGTQGDGCYDRTKAFVGEDNFISVDTDHGQAATQAFLLDSDGNGMPDAIEWLYSDEE